MDPEIRDRRRAARRLEARRRLLAAAVLVVAAHLVGAPLLILSIPVGVPQPAEPEVALVRVPASQWDAARAAAEDRDRPRSDPTAPLAGPPPPPEPPPPAPQRPGQVVETAPGNDEKPPDDTPLVAETNNRVRKQTIAADRKAGQKITMPRSTTSAPPSESARPAPAQPQMIGGDPGERSRLPSELQPSFEIPRLREREKLALKFDPEGAFRNREATEEVPGNSDRLRLQAGTGDREAAGGGGQPGARELTTLVPSTGVLERITGGPAPDHVDGVDEGDATFLNTREWRFASFFNRVMSTVAAQWDPGDVVRRRDPTGDMFLWKDRYTLLTVRLRDDGRLADVWIERSSGVDFLDEEAVAAFQKAQPFPNPPRGLADENGEIRFTFGFFLETSRPSFRVFRR